MKTKNLWKRLVGIGLMGMVAATAGWGAVTNNPTISLSCSPASLAEGNSGTSTVTCTVGIDVAPNKSDIKLTIATSNGSAMAGSDYVALSQTLTFQQGGSTANQSFNITVNGDTTFEPNETFSVSVTNNSTNNSQNFTLPSFKTITINNDDSPEISISPSTVTTTEGNTGTTNAPYTVTLSGTPSSAVTVQYAAAGSGTNPATSGSDFTATSGTLTFAAGTTTLSQTINVPIIGDTTLESNETYTVTLSNATNATISTATATGTITNDDFPTLSISPSTLSTVEGHSGTTNAAYTVTLSASPSSAVSVQYAAAGSGTNAATSGSDFTATSGTLTFAAGTTTLSQTINVPIIGDTTVESNETYTVTLSNATNATISVATATGTITNDDTAGGGGGTTAPTFPSFDACGLFPSPLSTQKTLNANANGGGIVVSGSLSVNAKTLNDSNLECTMQPLVDTSGNSACRGNGANSVGCYSCVKNPPPPVLTLPTFLLSANSGPIAPVSGTTLAQKDTGKITVPAILNFQATEPYSDPNKRYMIIGDMTVTQNGTTLNFSEGDYWIKKLDFTGKGNNLTINVTGKVRLFFYEDVTIGGNSININSGGSASDLLIFAYKNVTFTSNGGGKYDISAFWYVKDTVQIDMSSGAGHVTGGITSEGDITVSRNQDFSYPVGNLPDGFGECVVTYNFQAGVFDAVDLCTAKNNSCINTNIKTKIVNNPFSLTSISLNTARNALQTRNPTVTVDASLAKNNGTSYDIVKSLGNVSFTSGTAAVDIGSITHDSAARDIRVLFRFCKDASGGIYSWNGGVCSTGQTKDYALSSDAFAIRPSQFSITGVATPNLLKAGETYGFSLYANPYGVTGATGTADYNQSSVNLSIAAIKRMPDNTVNAALSGTASFPSAFALSNGIASGANMTFSDVGRITVDLNDTEWASIDASDTALSDRTIHGEGNYTYIPYQFAVSGAGIVNSRHGTFTYLSNDLNMSAKLDFNVAAQNKQGATTANFANGRYENPVSITPVITDAVGGDGNETTVTASLVGFASGTTHLAWDDTNASKVLRFNFNRSATPLNPFTVDPADVNVTVASSYTDGGTTVVIENNTTNKSGAANGMTGNATMLYGRADAPDYRFATPSGCGRVYFEFYNTVANNPIVTAAFGGMPPLSQSPDRGWYQNTLHDISTDGNVSTFAASHIDATGTTGCMGTGGLGTQKRAFVYDTSMGYPYRATMSMDASDWLDTPNSNFGVEYRQAGAWIGVESNTHTNTDRQSELNSNRRVTW